MRRLLALGSLVFLVSGCAQALPLESVGAFSTDPQVNPTLAGVSGGDVTINLATKNFKVVDPASATDPHKFGEGHIHIFLDSVPTPPGEVTPKIAGKIFHTFDSVYTIHDVTTGTHFVWVELGFSDHLPYPNAAVKLTFNVGNGAANPSPEASPSAAPAASPSPSPAAAASPSASSGGAATLKIQLVTDATNGGAYKPDPSTAHVGDTVEWDWIDASAPHSVTAEDGSFDSGVQSNPFSYKFTFAKAGTFKYKCLVHPNMLGQITIS